MGDVRRLTPLGREESLKLLGTVSLGRVVYTHLALPAIRPVSHLVENDQVIFRSQPGAVITATADDGSAAVVAYEADLMDPEDHLGWSVIVIGRARRVSDPADIERYNHALRPWATGVDDEFVAIQADMVDGFRFARAADVRL